jgi:hypothetical protein
MPDFELIIGLRKEFFTDTHKRVEGQDFEGWCDQIDRALGTLHGRLRSCGFTYEAADALEKLYSKWSEAEFIIRAYEKDRQAERVNPSEISQYCRDKFTFDVNKENCALELGICRALLVLHGHVQALAHLDEIMHLFQEAYAAPFDAGSSKNPSFELLGDQVRALLNAPTVGLAITPVVVDSPWASIESAPTDGKPVYVFDPKMVDLDARSDGVFEAFWHRWLDDEQEFEGWVTLKPSAPSSDLSALHSLPSAKVLNPTLWMRRPESPVFKQQA